MIRITLLGTGALLPTPERALSAALLTCGGRSVLFDCGEGTQVAARRAGVSLMKTDLIALTHYHGDHIFGLPGLLETMGSMGRTEPLTITGPEGLREAMEPILRLTGWAPFTVRLLTLPAAGLPLAERFPGWDPAARLTPFATEHRVPSAGYTFTLARAGRFDPAAAQALGVPVREWRRLQQGCSVQANGRKILPGEVLGRARKGLKLVFSGDTAACEALTEAARGADLLICDATYATDDKEAAAAEYGHMTFAQAARTAARAEVKRLWLTHFSQSVEDPAAYLPNAAAIFPAAECAADGMACELRFCDD